ncbi:MAG: alanine/glycine:cation symporter family protein [Planctomycetota bacterium]|nr:alanine/glycine:cation symporter family protein [Planctomycetota bacterium]MDA0920807.1 alanine/glycine:cation symporter family protein [Planctomycetota bacterium]MDA1158281.1 alanine/glycine:cation symporter family protein [Planctomycetota bacterium]
MRTVVTSRILLSTILAATLLLNSPPVFAQESAETQESKEVVTSDVVAPEISEPADTETANTETAPAPPAEEPKEKDGSFQGKVNDVFGEVNEFLAYYMFYNVLDFFGNEKVDGKDTIGNLQLAVIWLVLGSIFFTIRMGFINVRAFKHSILVTAGRYDNPDDAGEVSHFQALTSALSATIGLGNIAGVAIAVSLGGPGATFWMIVAGFIGMTSKFVECTLGQKYREVRPDGRVMGGAMFYLSRGLKKKGLGPVGAVLGFVFAVLCIGGSFGGGCSFQVNQSLNAVAESIEFLKDDGNRWIYGAVMTAAVGVVIIGGIRSIARVAEKIVPTMCGVYVLSALAILLMNAALIPEAISSILTGAFSDEALYGGFIGVLVTGFKRAAFSNEAGVGSAAIAHAAAKTEHPVREGIVALLGPFIDTVVICTMTALVIVITGAYNNPDPLFEAARNSNQGATLTSLAMDSQIAGFRYVLAIAVTLFAYSTMISWSYYGERCWAYIFGDRSSMVYRIIFLCFVFLGSIVSATNVLEFGDLMILGMAFPNVIGVVFLSGEVAADLKVYWQKYKAGEFIEYGKSK